MLNLPGNSLQQSSISPSDPNANYINSSTLDGLLRREDLAKQLGVSPRTIDRWHALRQGPPRVCIGRTILYRIDAVRQWLQKREQQFEISAYRKRR
jgi:predicted DNA-binding transcriptional regulator AlpA